MIEQRDYLKKEDLQKELQKFKEFAFQRSMIELSVAFILGAAFNKVVAAISNNLIMPVINAILSTTGTQWRDMTWSLAENIEIEVGAFLGSFVDFLLTALVLYFIYVKVIKKLLRD